MLGAMLFLIVMQTAASIRPAADYTLSPRNADPAPTIDGVLESTWGTHYSSVMNIQIGAESQNTLRVYTCVFNDFIYFGLHVRVSTHSANESLAIACSNDAPGSTSVNDSIWSYSVAKIVRMDGKSWDWKIYGRDHIFSNWSETPNPNSIDLKTGFGASNFSFYELRFGRVLPREDLGDVNWARKQSYLIKIFYGTLYGNGTDSNTPKLASWTAKTGMIALTIPAAPNDPTSPEIEKYNLNVLAWKVSLFIVAGFALALVGVYIVRTKSRIRRV
jgi:hypothetical protein